MNIKLLLLLLVLLSTFTLKAVTVEPETSNLIPISVSVTGDVAKPGIYNLTTMHRVSEVLRISDFNVSGLSRNSLPDMSLTGNSPTSYTVPSDKDTSYVNLFGNRAVILNRQGQKQVLDLLRFYRLGDISQNPFLKDGDIITVNPAKSVISLQGSVHRVGDYEFRENDTLKDLLDLALGVTEDADLRYVKLFRYKEGFVDFDKIELDITGYPDDNNTVLDMLLMPGDRILIPSNSEYRKAYKVQVTGKVKMPGMYYVDDNTSLYDLLVMCGGPTQKADLNSSFVYNRLVSGNFDPDFNRLSRFAYNQMTWLEYSYMRTKTRQLKGKYSIDVEKCWNSKGKEANLVLRDTDELYVPEVINGVWVAGQVKNPGLVTWNQDLKWKDYLALAGGFANNRKAQGTRIIRTNSGNWIKATDKVQLNPGDIIFVPDKEERYLWDDIKDFILITSQLLTIIILARSF